MTDTPTAEVAAYIAGALAAPLPEAVAGKTAAHVLDTLAAILSGGPLAAGRAGAAMVERFAGPAEALAIVPGVVTGAPTAALANAMAGTLGLLPSDINPWTSVVTSMHLSPHRTQAHHKARFRFFTDAE
ncbi:MAG: hypothetical protein AAFZ09_04790, partial [Pseudomonadota bacterium]